MTKLTIKYCLKYTILNLKAIFCYLFFQKSIDIPSTSTIFITHNLGGGTTFYENIFPEINIIFVRKIGYGKDFIYEIMDRSKQQKTYVDKEKIYKIFDTHKNFIVNSLCSLTESDNIRAYLVNRKQSENIHIIYMVHDFNCICKNNSNLIYNEMYCEIKCAECRYFKNEYIKDYQDKWRCFLLNCDEIRTFSKSSKVIVKNVYPELVDEKITVVPHDTSYCNNYEKIDSSNRKIHIGIIGNCNGIAKGEKIVQQFLKYAKKECIPVTVIGKIKFKNKIKAKNIEYKGKYKRNELSDFIEKSGISVCLFPSIWPETFSYLVSELIAMEMPVAGYNFGAQGEKLKNYKNGIILNSTEPSDIFSSIKSRL